jgi:xanthine dehydrogenase accessory factor
LHRTLRIVIKGGGDLGSGIAWRLHRSKFQVLITDIEQPTTIRRTVAFASAIYDGAITVEGIRGQRIYQCNDIERVWRLGELPVIEDNSGQFARKIKPDVLVDATLAKKNMGTLLTDAPLVIALGPGFTTSMDCHAIVETNRGHNLGRVIWNGKAEVNTGIPGSVAGESSRRVLLAPISGMFKPMVEIGSFVSKDQVVAYVDEVSILAKLSGVVRGMLHSDLIVSSGMKIGDIDPRGNQVNCFTISDKALAVAGGVLEAILSSTLIS